MEKNSQENSGIIDKAGLSIIASRTSNAEKETIEIGRLFASGIQIPSTVCVSGQLGAGKTQFVKGIAQHFEFDSEKVVSPTFGIMNCYQGKELIQHLDVYRLNDEDEFLNLGPDELFENIAFTVIEWGEKFQQLLPKETIFVQFEILDTSKRRLNFLCNQHFQESLRSFFE